VRAGFNASGSVSAIGQSSPLLLPGERILLLRHGAGARTVAA